MKKSLKLFSLAVLLIMGITQAQAQRGPGGGHKKSPEERAQKQTERMAESLSLSDEQREKVADINLKYAEKRKATRDENRSAKREAMESIRTEQESELESVLTPEQFEKLKKDREEMRKKHGEKKGKGKHKKTKPIDEEDK